MTNKLKSSLIISLLLVVLVIIWVLVTMVFRITRSVLIPSPVDLYNAFIKLAPSLPKAIVASLRITMIGFGIGVGFGLGMGLMMGYSSSFLRIMGPFMEVTRPIPTFAMIPLFMLWFGLGQWPQILLIALGVSAVLGVQTYEAIRNLPIVYVRAAFNLGANKRFVFRTVVIPYIIPHLIGAIRVAAATSWGLDVAAEFMGVQIGLGYIMIVQQMYLNTSGIIVVILIYSIMAIAFDQLIQRIEKPITHWTDRSKLSFDGM